MLKKMTLERATEMMDANYHCSQVVATHAAECMGLDVGRMVRMSSGLCGGCVHGDTCGTISGAILAISIVYGSDVVDEERDVVMKEKIREFTDKFVAKHGSTLCRDLLDGYDNADPNRVARDDTWAKCPQYCVTACELLDEIIGDTY